MKIASIGKLLLLLFLSISAFVASSFAERYIPNETGIGNLKSIDSAVNWGNGKAYFFKGNQYIRYDIKADKADPGYPKPINQSNWPGFPWNDGITAAVNWGNGKAYFFNGNQYIRYDIASDKTDPGYPNSINQSTWPGLPWNEIDAGVNWGNGKAYFFRGNQYIRYDIAFDKADLGYPKPINQSNWPGLPWDQIDAAANWGNGKAYFFKGNQYIRYDIKADKADPGYPKPINQSNWPGLW
jgi:matrix metalloproteinase-14 (membrane-inserted)